MHVPKLLTCWLMAVCFWGFGLHAQVYTDYVGAGHNQDVTVTASSGAQADATVSGQGLQPDLYEASRFLSQAAFGADYETMVSVADQGFEGWIDGQFTAPTLSYADTADMIWEHFKQAYINQWGQVSIEGNPGVFPLLFYWRMAWWNNTIKGEDLLRQRIAMALSEIMVISEKSELGNSSPGLASYYDVLYQNAFGNFRDLIWDVTLHPSMGFYLDHINNPRSNPLSRTRPDENYAREVMQLFTIGLFELNPDGSRKQDQNGEDIPTYDNDDIKEFAKIFTGLGPAQYYSPWEDRSNIPVIWGLGFNGFPTNINMTMPMQMFDAFHEPGNKFLLNGQVVPAGQTGMQDLSDAIDNLFNHPNVGPFIGRQLIQRLVKSNPSPAYISRVSAAFADNGQGVRGDMKAVIKAVLLDPEARDCSWIDDPISGKLREPLLRAIHLFKAFNLYNASGQYWNLGFSLERNVSQHTLAPPSVFNFFLPDFQPNGAIADMDLVAPEFQLHDSRSAVDYFNYMYFSLLSDYYMEISTTADPVAFASPNWSFNDAPDQTFLELTDEVALANNPLALIDRLDMIMCGGGMTEATKQTILTAVQPFGSDPDILVKVAIYLTTLSPDYNIQK